MSDYEAAPRRRSSNEVYRIPGQTKEFCEDIHEANVRGISYGVYMGRKRDMENQEYYEKFGTHLRQRRRRA